MHACLAVWLPHYQFAPLPLAAHASSFMAMSNLSGLLFQRLVGVK